ncbi:hypothetical protein ABT317_22180, partial [Streptomyces carpinensis]
MRGGTPRSAAAGTAGPHRSETNPEAGGPGRRIHLELCPVCDAGDVDRTTVELLVRFSAGNGGRDRARTGGGASRR